MRLVLLALLTLVTGCNAGRGDSAGPSSASVAAPSAPPSGVVGEPVAPAPSASAAGTVAGFPVAADTRGCPDGMIRVEGEYCPAVIQNCVEHHTEYKARKADKNVSERCLRYEEPSKCLSKERKHLAFCVDRFEYPNKIGEIPRVLTSWVQAKKTCEGENKRLCTEDEFNFACEGPDIRPYVYGFTRDKSVCNIDKEYRYPDHSKVLPTYDKCLETPSCKDELTRLDQREKIGERTTCVSWSGVYDLNGNVNEWVELPGEKPPNRSGLKGGWWGPVRSRCRPTVTFHKEGDYGYEAGFRCCSDASP